MNPFATVEIEGRPVVVVRDPRDVIVALSSSAARSTAEQRAIASMARDLRERQAITAAWLWDVLIEDIGDASFVRFEDGHGASGQAYEGAPGQWRADLDAAVADATTQALADLMARWGYL